MADSELISQLRSRLAGLPCSKNSSEKFTADELASFSDSDCTRFLLARDKNVDKAADMARNCLEWRLKYRPDKVEPREIQSALKQGCWRFAGWAKDGRPVMLIQAAKWKPTAYDGGLDEYNKYVGYMMENNIARAKKGTDKQLVIFDMADFSTLQCNFKMIRALVSINQDYYPERLSMCVMGNAPRLFRWAWNTISPWFDEKTRKKICLLGSKQKMSDILLEHIDAQQLLAEYGGSRQRPYPIPPQPGCGMLGIEDSEDSTLFVPAPAPPPAKTGARCDYEDEEEGASMTAPFSEFRPASGTKDVVYAVFTRAVLKSLGIEHAEVESYATQSLSGTIYRVKLRVAGDLWQCDVMQPLSEGDEPFVVDGSLVKGL